MMLIFLQSRTVDGLLIYEEIVEVEEADRVERTTKLLVSEVKVKSVREKILNALVVKKICTYMFEVHRT